MTTTDDLSQRARGAAIQLEAIESWLKVGQPKREVEVRAAIDLLRALADERDRLRELVQDMARYIGHTAPDGDVWDSDGGLADRVDSALNPKEPTDG